MLGQALVGSETTYFFEGINYISALAGGDATIAFEVGPVLDARLPIFTVEFDVYLENNALAGFIPKVPTLAATGLDGPLVVSCDLSLPKLTTEFHKAADLDVSTPAMTGAFTADYITVGTLASNLPLVVAGDWSGTTAVVATMAATLPRLQAAIEGAAGAAAVLAAALPKFTAQFSGALGVAGAMAGNTPALTASFTAFVGVNGDLALVLPKLTAAFASGAAAAYQRSYVANLANNILTEFANYEFTSVTEFGGKFYGTKSDGIYLLEGATDNTAPIDLSVDLGNLDFGNRNQKRVSDFYMAYNTDGKMKVTVSTDETSPYSYSLSSYGVETIKQRRVALGKGLRGKYWNIKIENVNGADLRIESLHLRVALQNRRI